MVPSAVVTTNASSATINDATEVSASTQVFCPFSVGSFIVLLLSLLRALAAVDPPTCVIRKLSLRTPPMVSRRICRDGAPRTSDSRDQLRYYPWAPDRAADKRRSRHPAHGRNTSTCGRSYPRRPCRRR